MTLKNCTAAAPHVSSTVTRTGVVVPGVVESVVKTVTFPVRWSMEIVPPPGRTVGVTEYGWSARLPLASTVRVEGLVVPCALWARTLTSAYVPRLGEGFGSTMRLKTPDARRAGTVCDGESNRIGARG